MLASLGQAACSRLPRLDLLIFASISFSFSPLPLATSHEEALSKRKKASLQRQQREASHISLTSEKREAGKASPPLAAGRPAGRLSKGSWPLEEAPRLLGWRTITLLPDHCWRAVVARLPPPRHSCLDSKAQNGWLCSWDLQRCVRLCTRSGDEHCRTIAPFRHRYSFV